MSGLRVLALVSDAYGALGGIAKFNRDLLGALAQSRHVVRVDVLPRLMPEETLRPPEFVLVDRPAAAGKLAYGRRVLRHCLPGARPDIVLCGHLNLLPFAAAIAGLRRARLALVIHGVEAWTAHPSALTRRLVRRVDARIAVSRYSAGRFASWAGEKATFILPNCVDLDQFVPAPPDPELRARYRLGEGPVLFTLTRLDAGERYKGVDETLEAMPALLGVRPELRYLIGGDGSDRERLERKAHTLGLSDTVIFAGRIAEEEKAAHYNLASLYVMPSSGEGFGIAFIEAAACGAPVIAGNRDGSREAALEGALGALVDPSDPEAIAAAILAELSRLGPRVRHPGLATFGADAFRTRVAEWCADQAAAREATCEASCATGLRPRIKRDVSADPSRRALSRDIPH